MNMFQMIVIFTLDLKNGLLNLGFGIYYDHCELVGCVCFLLRIESGLLAWKTDKQHFVKLKL